MGYTVFFCQNDFTAPEALEITDSVNKLISCKVKALFRKEPKFVPSVDDIVAVNKQIFFAA